MDAKNDPTRDPRPSFIARRWWPRGSSSPLDASTLLGVLRPLTIVLGLLCVLYWLPGYPGERVVATGVNLLLMAAFVGCGVAARRGAVRAASLAAVITLVVVAGVVVALYGGLGAMTSAVLLLCIPAASALLGWRGAVMTGLAIAVIATVLAALELAGVVPVLMDHLALVGSWGGVMAIVGITLAFLGLFASNVEKVRQTAVDNELRAAESERRLGELVRESPDGIFSVDEDGVILEFNPAARRMLAGGESLGGRRVAELTSLGAAAGGIAKVLAEVRGAGPRLEALELVHGDGLLHVEASLSSVAASDGSEHVHVVLRDVSGRHEAERVRHEVEARLHESQRLESLGRLAGGVAHDFRNLLTAIIANAELASDRPGLPAEAAVELAAICEAGLRASRLTGQLLAFARREMVQPQVLDLSEVVDGLRGMLAPLLRDNIEVCIALSASPVVLEADRGQLEQVVLNLAVNASDAMPDGGRLEVETRAVTVGPADEVVPHFVPPGRYAVLAVRDTGEGMDKLTQGKIFDPFFTTKPVGKGTGLGLATVRGIAIQWGGHIAVRSAPGQGSSFEVYLPRVDAAVPRAEPKAAAARPASVGKTILVADDEGAVRSVVCRVLRRSGHQVLAAANGHEAVTLAGAHQGELHLVVADVVMPGPSGRELAERLRADRPGLRVVYVSGYAEDLAEHEGADPDAVFLAKPFTPEVLLGCVAQALGDEESA